jgi:hypothetical protein
MKRAAIYLRVSTDRQTRRAFSDEGYSIETQRERCRARLANWKPRWLPSTSTTATQPSLPTGGSSKSCSLGCARSATSTT